VLRTVKILGDRFANPAYGLLLLTGLTMVWVGDVDLTQFWLATALVLYALLVVLGWRSTRRRCERRSARTRTQARRRTNSSARPLEERCSARSWRST
jgi:membrane protein implicated in regulation of membrane protease activity